MKSAVDRWCVTSVRFVVSEELDVSSRTGVMMDMPHSETEPINTSISVLLT